jgi:hypothetical protein
MSGAIFGAWLMDEGPIFPVGARITGFLSMILVCVERVALGKHSIGQVTAGASIGIFLHIYSSTRARCLCCCSVVSLALLVCSDLLVHTLYLLFVSL